MLEVVLDTETTGLSTTQKHRIVEIGCIELENQIPTNKVFHEYLNPQRPVSEDAYKVHGYSDEFLADKKTFTEIAESFINFIDGKRIIIHLNATRWCNRQHYGFWFRHSRFKS